MANRTGQWLLPALVAVAAGVAAWYFWLRAPAPAPAVAEPPVETPAPATIGPLHPVDDMPQQSGEPRDLVPLPSLDQSDEYFKLGLTDVLGHGIDDLMANSGIIQRIVATVDNLPRSHVAERIRPLGRLAEPFRVDAGDGSGAYYIDATNAERYKPLVDIATAADLDRVTDLYRRFYPLFQHAYEDLGYPDGYFNDRLVEVIDHLLATPDAGGRIALVRPHVNYEYEDPDLEALSSGQKLLVRMGPDNARRIKNRLRELRDRVTRL